MSQPDLIYVRASVASTCNLSCQYCPKNEGMENRVPIAYKNNRLSTKQYISNLINLSRNGIRGISFTGGEPTINKDLPIIIQEIRPYFDKIELTTNGFKYSEIAHLIYEYIDVVKISLDTSSPESLIDITNGIGKDYERAINAINTSCFHGMNVGVNLVLTKQNYMHIRPIIKIIKEINRKYNSNAYISLLDFYYTKEKKKYWESHFIPVENVKEKLIEEYGNPVQEERFGCGFYWFDADGVKIRLKDSMSATRRAKKCNRCEEYCQEGIFALKHSVEGWITTCPSNKEHQGKLLDSTASIETIDKVIQSVISDIHASEVNKTSFNEMLIRNNLNVNGVSK